MRRILITVLILLIIGVGGYAAYYYLSIPKTPTTTEDGGVERRTFNPFGFFGEGMETDRDGEEDGFVERDDFGFIPTVRRLSSVPVAGAVFISGTDGVVRYIERGTGHVFETSVDSLTARRISNTTIPQIQNVLWDEGGSALIIQYLRDTTDSVETFLAEIEEPEEINNEAADEEEVVEPTTPEPEPGGLVGDFLPTDITDITIQKGDENVFYLAPGQNGSVGVRVGIDGTGASQVFSSPIRQWLSEWVNDNLITLTTKPSYAASGILFSLSPNTGRLRQILGGVPGLTTKTSPDGEKVLYSASIENSFTLNLYDTTDGSSYELPITTLPEKCVWSGADDNIVYCAVPQSIPRGDYPDMWYQGVVSFSDMLWRLDVETGSAELLMSPQDFGVTSLDMTHLSLNENQTHVLFSDKNTSVWWLARIMESGFEEMEDESEIN